MDSSRFSPGDPFSSCAFRFARYAFVAIITVGLLGIPPFVWAYGGKPTLILHVSAPANPTCNSVPASLQDVVTVGASSQTGDARAIVYVLADIPDPLYQGIDHLTFGIWYERNATPVPGIEIEGWESCAPGEYPDSDWPLPQSEITLQWGGLSGGCQESSTFVAGWFEVNPVDPGTMSLWGGPDNSVWLAGCGLRSYPADHTLLGWVSFGGAASEGETDGCNPWESPCYYRNFPPPEPLDIMPQDPAIMLHVAAAGGRSPCFTVPTEGEDIVTAAEARTDGSARYFVYLLGAPRVDNDGWTQGLAGMQLAIRYGRGREDTSSLGLHRWQLCADLEFPRDDWPQSGSGNTITWVTPENCQRSGVVTAGFFEVSAYEAASMAVVPFPITGQIKVANCSGSETVVEQVLPPTRAGWVSLGGAVLGSQTGGCNPLLEPCLGTTPVEPTTWGKIKTLYR